MEEVSLGEPMATVQVKLFAVLRERLGAETHALEFEGALTAAGLLDRMRDRWPEHARVFDQCRVAVNRVFVAGEHPIAAGDEVALIPPIAGG